jgi:hypothetical protein
MLPAGLRLPLKSVSRWFSKNLNMKLPTLLSIAVVFTLGACASEFGISSSDVPDTVMKAFTTKYPGATEVEWEAEKDDGKLYYEAEFRLEGKRKEAYFRPDGTFTKEE